MDPASAILSAVAVLFGLGALWCVRRLVMTSGAMGRLAWAGRAFALLGAAFAIWFPAELYGELTVVVRTGSDDVVWLPRAIWISAATSPLLVLPALIALRAPRVGGLLFVLTLVLHALEELTRPFGVLFPDASHDVIAAVFSYGPLVLTSFLLLLGRDGPALDEPLSRWAFAPHDRSPRTDGPASMVGRP